VGPYFAAIFDTIFCAHFWHIMTSIWAPFHGPWVPTLRPFSTQYFAQIFGTSCHPSGHHFMDPVDTIPPPFLSLPLALGPLLLRPLWISLPQSSALLPTTGLGSLSEWQHAHLVNRAVRLGPRKETVDSTIQARSTDRALQCQLVCVRRKNKHNATPLDKQKF
jgi:hypothetical protein